MAGILISELLPVLSSFDTCGINAYVDEWRSHDCMKNKRVTLFLGNKQIDGVVQGIDENGLLTMELTDGNIQSFASGEVSFNSAL